MRLTYGQFMVGTFALCAAIPACGGGSKCCLPVAPVSTKDADSARDAPLDHGVDGVDERQTDASTADAKDGPGGLPCLKASWDGGSNQPDICQNEIGSTPFLVTGMCGDYRLVEDATDGDDEIFYYYDASGALVAIVHSGGGQYRCSAGLVAVIDRPCIYRNSPSVTRLFCRGDAGPTD